MIRLEDTDFAKELSVVGQRMCRQSADIVLEISDPLGAEAFAERLEEMARQIRLRALDAGPVVIEG